MQDIYFFTSEEVVEFHKELIRLYGGKYGIRDVGLLESAIHQPQISFGGKCICKDIYEMTAAYFYHIIKNHPFVDGNKRVAVMVSITFLRYNDVEIVLDQDQLYFLAIDVANSKISKQKISNFFKKNVSRN